MRHFRTFLLAQRAFLFLVFAISLAPSKAQSSLGDVLWTFSGNGIVQGSPTLAADGTVYITTDAGYVYALDPSGAKKWEFKTAGANYTTTIGLDGTIYFCSEDSYIYALDPFGALKWKFAAGSVAWPPRSRVALAANGDLYVLSADGNLHKVDSSGNLVWKLAITGLNNADGVTLDSDGTVYVKTEGFGLLALNPDSSPKWAHHFAHPEFSSPIAPAISADRIYVMNERFLVALDKTGSFQWETNLTHSLSPPTIAADGTIYLSGLTFDDGHPDPGLTALNPNGSVKWKILAGAYNASAPVLTADGHILVTGWNPVANIVDGDGNVSASVPTVHLGTYTSPVVSPNGVAYLCGQTNLYAVRVNSGPAGPPWPTLNGNALHTGRLDAPGDDIVLLENPISQTIVSGQPVTLGVAAASVTTLSYQWYFNGTAQTGETSAQLHVTTSSTSNDGDYWVVLANAASSITSAVAHVSIQYTVTATASSGGTVAKTPAAASYAPGASVSVSASPATGFAFVEWTGDATGSDNPISLTADSNIVLNAVFRPYVDLHVSAPAGGHVNVSPTQDLYVAETDVTLTAVPDTGFEFQSWSGDVASTDNPLAFTLHSATTLTAHFVDVAAPAVTITTPVSETTTNESFVLHGTVSDNGALDHASYTLNGGSPVSLTVVSGEFNVPDLKLVSGTNIVHVDAVDSAGNTNSAEAEVVWTPLRILTLGSPAAVVEGNTVSSDLVFTSSGEVGAVTFKFNYDTNYITVSDVAWNEDLGAGLRGINTSVPGQVVGSYVLAGTTIPAGTTNLATLTFRPLSVPSNLVTSVSLAVSDISDDTGTPLPHGNLAIGAAIEIDQRHYTGDNNANDRLDVGDATVIQRLLAGLDPVRSWDVGLNDLNGSATLDSGDVIRVLRAVVGLDPQPGPPPPPPPAMRAFASSKSRAALAGPTLRLSPATQTANPGDIVVYTLALEGFADAIAGISFRLEYDPAALRLLNSSSYSIGSFVPSNAAVIWNSGAPAGDFSKQSGRISFAASRAQAWTGSGPVAQISFQVQPAAQFQDQWPITITKSEISATGFQIAAVAGSVAGLQPATIAGVEIASNSVVISDGQFKLSFNSVSGIDYIIETSTDLKTWSPAGTITGSNGEATFTVTPSDGAHFYRVQAVP